MNTNKVTDSPKPWKSQKKTKNKITPVGIAFLIILSYFLLKSSLNTLLVWSFIALSIIMIIITIIVFFEKKDKWIFHLPFNSELFRIINKEIENLLIFKNYNYRKEDRFALQKTKDNLAYSFTVGIAGVADFSFVTKFIYHPGRYSGKTYHPSTYISNLEITNICLENLSIVKDIALEMIDILEGINYKEFIDEK